MNFLKKTTVLIISSIIFQGSVPININSLKGESTIAVKESGICSVSKNYGIQAYNEKMKSDLSLMDFFTLTVYGLKQGDSLSNLSQSEQEIFVNFIYDTYEFVYSSKGLTKENISDKLIEHCESRKSDAVKSVSKRYLACQARGLFYENLSKHRYNDEDINFVKSVYAGFLRKNPEKYKAISSALDFVYDNKEFKTPSFLGKQVYKECLVE